MTYTPGSLVRVRQREWVVLPESTDELLMVRPLGGAAVETTGIVTALEPVESATFDLPDPTKVGDAHSARLLRDAMRLGFRSSAGPFRSVGSLAVTPRPYQLVPLLMALKLDPVRLLLADDVGIGKTVEAGLIIAELIAQGDADRLCVLCPPHLAEQWRNELAEKFHIEAELVLASTAARLERNLPIDKSIFDVYPYTVVSIDFIKSERRRDDFIRSCPNLVVVDEAHSSAPSGQASSHGSHQRYALVKALAQHPKRHMILVTATPHSGNEDAFRSLLTLLDEDFRDLPDDLSGDHNRRYREQVARHLVQRRRGDIQHYLEADTEFPVRKDSEFTYGLSLDYAALFDEVLDFARSTVRDASVSRARQRVRWWSALGLLRALASSPAAAAATMRTRAQNAEMETVDEVDEIGRQVLLDLDDGEEVLDVVPGVEAGEDSSALSRRLRQLANAADQLHGDQDTKLVELVGLASELVEDGFNPIVFCRFVDTAEYVGDQLRTRIANKYSLEVDVVSGRLPAAERVECIERLSENPRRLLVATDCLSEGINLQDNFDAVIHYDLPWNPTRLEQREGRVDRFGQPKPEVRVITYYGTDNTIDKTVLDVLLRKHRTIRSALGVSLSVPGGTSEVINALAENVLLSDDTSFQLAIPGLTEQLQVATNDLHSKWDQAANRERRSRSIFAQNRIRPDEVAAELHAMQQAIGSGADVADFSVTALKSCGAHITGDKIISVHLNEVAPEVRDALGPLGSSERLRVAFDLPVPDEVHYLERTHPLVAGLASHVLDQALDTLQDPIAARSGVIRTRQVTRRTNLFLCRLRVKLTSTSPSRQHHMLVEDAMVMAFRGSSTNPEWLSVKEASALLDAAATGNVNPQVASEQIVELLAEAPHWQPFIHQEAERRAEAATEAHSRVRQADQRAGVRAGVRFHAEAHLPVDILGAYIYLPDIT